MERFLYLFNADTGAVGESHNVTELDETSIGLIKLQMLFHCTLPWELIDSADIVETPHNPFIPPMSEAA